MTKIGLFKVEDQFNLTGRGLVILGQLIDGELEAGANLKLEIDDKPVSLKIKSVEFADYVSEQKSSIGLLFAIEDEGLKEFFLNQKITEQVVEIYKE
jgi:hypothetical protein